MLSQNELQGILYESLIELGLTENERHLYVLSLSLGPTTITKLAEHLGCECLTLQELKAETLYRTVQAELNMGDDRR